MTALEAIRALAVVPVNADMTEAALHIRGVDPTTEFADINATSNALHVALADVLYLVGMTGVSVTEDGRSVSYDADVRERLCRMANSIYKQFGEPERPTPGTPTVEIIE